MPPKERPGDDRTPILATTVYNACLVKREFYLAFGSLDQWDDHLSRVNVGKRGRPFQYPEAFIARMRAIHVFPQMPYRQMEDFVWKLATVIPGFKAADYTALWIKDPGLALPGGDAAITGVE
jgi:hypothetical protein